MISSTNTFITISQAHLLGGGPALTEKLAQGAQTGFFYVEMPEKCKRNLAAAVELNHTYFTKNKYTELKLDGLSGYRIRPNTQADRLILEDKHWSSQLSPEIKELAEEMQKLGLDVLGKTLGACQIPNAEWDMATGGAITGRGVTHFTFNHYDPKKQLQGLPEHRDWGLVTVLYADEKTPGLQAKINGDYVDLPSKKDHFIINFGRSLETFVNNPTQLNAGWHRVKQVSTHRISFGVFIDNNFNTPLYQRDGSSYNVVEKTYEAFIEKLKTATYGK